MPGHDSVESMESQRGNSLSLAKSAWRTSSIEGRMSSKSLRSLGRLTKTASRISGSSSLQRVGSRMNACQNVGDESM